MSRLFVLCRTSKNKRAWWILNHEKMRRKKRKFNYFPKHFDVDFSFWKKRFCTIIPQLFSCLTSHSFLSSFVWSRVRLYFYGCLVFHDGHRHRIDGQQLDTLGVSQPRRKTRRRSKEERKCPDSLVVFVLLKRCIYFSKHSLFKMEKEIGKK